MNIELTRFKIRPGKSSEVDEWMNMLRSNFPAVIETLEGEKMYVEAIFREQVNGSDYLYWFSVQAEEGAKVSESTHEIDKQHLEYFKECIEPGSNKDMRLELFVKPDRIKFE